MSDRPVIRGLDDMERTRQRRRWSKRLGRTTESVYEGPLDKARDLFESNVGNDAIDDVALDPDKYRGIVTIVTADDETSETDNAIWEIIPQDVFKDARTHPYFNPSGSILEYLVAADEAIKRGEQYDYASVPNWSTQVQRYLGLRQAGVQGYLAVAPILRKTIVVSQRSLETVDYTNVMRVVELETEINPPAEILGSLSQITKIANYAGGYDPANPPLEATDWEWLKKFPGLRSLEGGKRFEVEYSWLGAEEWNLVFYGGGWDPQPA